MRVLIACEFSGVVRDAFVAKGHDASKKTCLWLKGLSLLEPTYYVEPRIVGGRQRWGNQTDSGQNKLPPSKERAMKRSRTYLGIAQAMAEQWGAL